MAVDQAIALAMQHAQAGRPDLAVAPLQQAVREDPKHADAHRLLAVVLFQTGQQAQGLSYAERAAALAPDRAEPLFYFGSMLAVTGQIDRAIPVLERAAGLDPRFAPVRGLLATCFMQKKDLDEAERWYREALAIDPKYVEARSNLGSVLQSTGRPQEALEVFRAAAADHRSHPGLWTAYCVGLNYADGVEAAEIRAAHEQYGRILSALPGQVKTDWPNTREPERRLRTGVVSCDLWEHSVAYFIRPILEQRDRTQFETFVYSTGPMADGMTRRLMAAADVWRDLKGANDQQLLQQIRGDGVDILLELSGQTQGSRLAALRLRGAPIQVTYIGYPNTTGVPAIDYRLVDAITDPPGGASESIATEKLVRLPGCFLCYAPPEDAPPVGPPPSEASGFVTFGSFNSVKKLTAGTISLWAGLLREAPRSRLVVKSNYLDTAGAQEHLRGLLAREGIAEERFDLLDRLESKREHFEAYGGIDIALDTTPYNGTTTTCEALWMGVPVVSLTTALHAGRVGLSLLTAVGLAELAAESAEEFRRIGVSLASDPARLAGLRRSMRERVAKSPLCDAPAFARRFEGALRDLWRRYCAGTGGRP